MDYAATFPCFSHFERPLLNIDTNKKQQQKNKHSKQYQNTKTFIIYGLFVLPAYPLGFYDNLEAFSLTDLL